MLIDGTLDHIPRYTLDMIGFTVTDFVVKYA